MKRRKTEQWTGKTLPGYSLLYVLLLLTMLIIILTGLITSRYFSKRESLEWMSRTEMECNVMSAITLLRDPAYSLPENQPVTLSLFDDMNDSITLYRSRWGFYNLVKTSSRFKNFTSSYIALCGDYRHREEEVALLLGASSKPLCLCGNTCLKGIFHVPKAGIKSATIAGTFYKREKLVEGVINAVDRPMPTIKPQYLRLQPGQLLSDYAPFSRVIPLNAGTFNDTLVNSFYEPTVIIYTNKEIKLDRCIIKGNVMVISDSVINIESSALITDAILCAKKIFIEPKFEGTGQFIATDTLRCGPLCTFPAPSILAVINGVVNPAPFLFIDEQCCVEGTIVTYSVNPVRPFTSICTVCKDSRVIGSLYANNIITLLGEVHGNVITPGFIMRNPVSIYENYLLDAVIDYSKQPDFFIGINYHESSALLNIIKWL